MSLVHTCSSRFGAAGFSLQQAGLAGGRPAVAAQAELVRQAAGDHLRIAAVRLHLQHGSLPGVVVLLAVRAGVERNHIVLREPA